MPLVSKSEAARLAGVTRQTIHRKVKSGELSATGNSIDTSELIRVFGAISDGTEPVTPMSQPDVAVQTTLQARVDGLESQLAVTREQLADTAKDRDEWRDIAKEATSNVKLITNQGGGAKSNDNLMAFAAVAFVVGIGLAYMMLRNDVTPSDVTVTPKNSPSDPVSYYEGKIDQIRVQEGLEPIGNLPDSVESAVRETVKKRKLSDPKQPAEQGADVTDDVTPELQADTVE